MAAIDRAIAENDNEVLDGVRHVIMQIAQNVYDYDARVEARASPICVNVIETRAKPR